MMTPIQARVFDYIRDYLAEQGWPPTVRQIQRELGYASPSTVQDIIDRLRRQGYLEGRERSLRPTRASAR